MRNDINTLTCITPITPIYNDYYVYICLKYRHIIGVYMSVGFTSFQGLYGLPAKNSLLLWLYSIWFAILLPTVAPTRVNSGYLRGYRG